MPPAGAITGLSGWDVRRYAEVDSTNRVVADLAREGAPAGLVVVADHQTAGRGRHGRRWESPPGSSLLVSVLVRPADEPDDLQLMTVAAGVAAVEACLEACSVEPRLKWPNDLVAGDLKLGGLLTELVPPTAVVIGLGLNVHWQEPLPAGATALSHMAGGAGDREALLQAFLARLRVRTEAVGTPTSREDLLSRYRRLCSTLGRRVAFEMANEEVTGRAVEIDDHGHLVVDHDGRTSTLWAGTIDHLTEGPA